MLNSLKKKLNSIWRQFKSGMFQMLTANALNRVIAMLSNMVITRILSRSDYGIWSYVLNMYSYFNMITGFGLLSGAFQFGAENQGKEAEYCYYKYCLKTGVLIDSVLVVAFLMASAFITFTFDNATLYIRWYIPIIIFEYILNLLFTVFRCENRIKDYAFLLNVNTILIALGTCIGACFGVMGVIIGKYIACILSFCCAVSKSGNEIKKIRRALNYKFSQVKELWHYSIFAGLSSALNSLVYLVDVSMIANIIKNEVDVANYKVATLIPNSLAFIPASVMVCILPTFIKHKDNPVWVRKSVIKIFTGMSIANIVICTACWLLAPFIITLLSGKQYLDAVPIFRILIIDYFISGSFRYVSSNILSAMRFVNYGLFICVVSTVLDIGLNYWFISNYGTIGAAYATFCVVIISSLLAIGYLIYKVRKMNA